MESLVQRFLENTVRLCLMRTHVFPGVIRAPFERWADKLLEVFKRQYLAGHITTALESMRAPSENSTGSTDLADLLEAELKAVVGLQDHALQSENVLPVGAASLSVQQLENKNRIQKINRALNASKSLLDSWGVVLDHWLPDWAKGLLKVGKELIEIYGPAR